MWPTDVPTEGVCTGDADNALLEHFEAVHSWADKQITLVNNGGSLSAVWEHEAVLVGHGQPHNLKLLFRVSKSRHERVQSLLERVTGEQNDFGSYLYMLDFAAWRFIRREFKSVHPPDHPMNGQMASAVGWALLGYDHSMHV